MEAMSTGWESTSPTVGAITHPGDMHAPAILLGQRVRSRNDLRRDSSSSIASSLALDLDLESSEKGESGSYAERDDREFESPLSSVPCTEAKQRGSRVCIQDHKRTLEACLDRNQPEAMVIDDTLGGQISKNDTMRHLSHQSAVRSGQKRVRYSLERNVNGDVPQAFKQSMIKSLPSPNNLHISASKISSPTEQTKKTGMPDAQCFEALEDDASSEMSFATAGEGSEDESQCMKIVAEKKADDDEIEEGEWEKTLESPNPPLINAGFLPSFSPPKQASKPQIGVTLPSRRLFASLLSVLSRLTSSASQVSASQLLRELLLTEPEALNKVRANNFAHYLSLAQQSGVPIVYSCSHGNPGVVWFRIYHKHLKEWNLTEKADAQCNLAKSGVLHSSMMDAQKHVPVPASSPLLSTSSHRLPPSSPLLNRLVEPSKAVLALISELVKFRNAGEFGRIRAKELMKRLPGVNDIDTLKMVVHLARLAGASIECDRDTHVFCKYFTEAQRRETLCEAIRATFFYRMKTTLKTEEMAFCFKTRFLDVFLAAKTTKVLGVLKQAQGAGLPLQISSNKNQLTLRLGT